MGSVVSIVSTLGVRKICGLEALVAAFAHKRRGPFDPYWLKENGEVLNILAATQQDMPASALQLYQPFYADLPARLEFFPQYFRFFLSLALSLETLGLAGSHSKTMAQMAVKQGCVQSLTGDIYRAETRYLLQACGIDTSTFWPGLDQRLADFMTHSAHFAVPNSDAAYQLTHIVFYLSAYGKTLPQLPVGTERSLRNIGTLAFLEQNSDILAETCLALHYAGFAIPQPWLAFVHDHDATLFLPIGTDVQDDYHCHLVNQWLLATIGPPAFIRNYPATPFGFAFPIPTLNLQRHLSQILFELPGRCDDWGKMRQEVIVKLQPKALNILENAEKSDLQFDLFFADFARVASR